MSKNKLPKDLYVFDNGDDDEDAVFLCYPDLASTATFDAEYRIVGVYKLIKTVKVTAEVKTEEL